MNARELQYAVMSDIKSLFSGDKFKTPLNKMETLKTYAQNLPQFDAQDIDDFFPYIIVRLEGGGVENQTDPQKVDVMLVIGIFDDGTEEYRPDSDAEFVGDDGWDNRNFGAMAVLEIMEKIQTHYEQKPSLENSAFYFDGPFRWAMQDEDSYPYYFGVCELTFTLAAPRKEVSKFV